MQLTRRFAIIFCSAGWPFFNAQLLSIKIRWHKGAEEQNSAHTDQKKR